MFFKKQIRWHKAFDSLIAAKTQIALGKSDTLQIGNKRICVAHTNEGLFAIQDKCPHNGASLGMGHCTEQNSIVCPVHRYHFDLRTGRAKSGIGDAARVYPVEIREEGVFIGFEESVWTLF